MKIVFYKQLPFDCRTKDWPPAQQIVFSYLLSKSIMDNGDAYYPDGSGVDYTKVTSELCDEQSMIEFSKPNIKQASQLLNLTRPTFYDTLNLLYGIGYLTEDRILCPEEIIMGGYYELMVQSGLTKQLLIFYSWLYDRAQHYNGMIDTFTYRIADLLNEKQGNIRVMINRLTAKGFIKHIGKKTDMHRKLQILAPWQQSLSMPTPVQEKT